MTTREYIEDQILKYLSQRQPADIKVSYRKFNEIIKELKPCIRVTITDTKIPGFTEEDLEGFLIMKTHQILRQNAYDYNKLPFGLFSISYRNFIRNILKMRERALGRGLLDDPIDDALMFGDLYAKPDVFEDVVLKSEDDQTRDN